MTEPKTEPRAEQALSVKIDDELLVISIGIKSLAFATESCPALEKFYEKGPRFGQFDGPKVFDPVAFAAAVVEELGREEEDGTTPVHLLFDQAAADAIENGADGIRMPGEEA